MVLCLDSGMNYRGGLLSAISTLADAWKAARSDTPRNCFRHAGLTLDDEQAIVAQGSVTDVPSACTQDLSDDLRNSGLADPDTMTFEKFAFIGCGLSLCAGLTDEEIVGCTIRQQL